MCHEICCSCLSLNVFENNLNVKCDLPEPALKRSPPFEGFGNIHPAEPPNSSLRINVHFYINHPGSMFGSQKLVPLQLVTKANPGS